MDDLAVYRTAYALRSYAEHFGPQDYTYKRDLGGLKKACFASDWQGHNAPKKRLRRAFTEVHEAVHPRPTRRSKLWASLLPEPVDLKAQVKSLGKHPSPETALILAQALKERALQAYHGAKRELVPEAHLPDGVLGQGSLYSVWEEDGEYFQLMQPTVGSRLADFLECDPQHPQAQALAEEVSRLLTAYHKSLQEDFPPGEVEAAPEEDFYLEFTLPEGGRGHAFVNLWDFGVYAYVFLKDAQGKPHHWASACLQGLTSPEVAEDPQAESTLREAVLNVIAGASEESFYQVVK